MAYKKPILLWTQQPISNKMEETWLTENNIGFQSKYRPLSSEQGKFHIKYRSIVWNVVIGGNRQLVETCWIPWGIIRGNETDEVCLYVNPQQSVARKFTYSFLNDIKRQDNEVKEGFRNLH